MMIILALLLAQTVGSPVPSKATVLGARRSDGALVHVKACDRVQPFSITFASAGASQVVAASVGQRVWICGVFFTQTNQVVLNFIEGTGSTCTTPSDVSGAASYAAQSGIALGQSPFALPFTNTNGTTLCLKAGAATVVGGWFVYSYQ